MRIHIPATSDSPHASESCQSRYIGMVKSQDNATVNSCPATPRPSACRSESLLSSRVVTYLHALPPSCAIMTRQLALALVTASILSNANARFATQGSSNVAVYWGKSTMTTFSHRMNILTEHINRAIKWWHGSTESVNILRW